MKEEVHDVKIKFDSSDNIVIDSVQRRQAVRIEYDKQTEDQRTE